jgi:hypothetical protein
VLRVTIEPCSSTAQQQQQQLAPQKVQYNLWAMQTSGCLLEESRRPGSKMHPVHKRGLNV